MTQTKTIEWKPFSRKHRNYIKAALNNRICVAEGAIRSGKTIDHCIIAAMYLEQCPDKIHLASGSTMPNAKLNIGACNGYGLENIFRGRCHWGKYKDNDALFIDTKTGEKIVIFSGGSKKNSYQKILGNSYGLWIATEINEHYDSDDSRESFVKVAFGRQAAAEWPLVLWDLNPCNPSHTIYKDYIDKYKLGLVGGYQYEHFLMADNLSISEERKREISSQYDPESIWYQRDILGKRCVAEGLIYRLFADNNKRYVIEDVQKHLVETKQSIAAVLIGCDFGHSLSANAAVAVGITRNYKELIVLDEFYTKKEHDPKSLYDELIPFIQRVIKKYGNCVVYADCAEPMMVRGLSNSVKAVGLNATVYNCVKHEIIDRIVLENSLLARDRIKIHKDCKRLIDGLREAVWDARSTKDERLDDGTSNIDILDALEYSICGKMKELEKAGHIK